MSIYFTQDDNRITGFLDDAIYDKALPNNATKIGKVLHQYLLKKQSQGATLVIKKGEPQAIFETPDLSSVKHQVISQVNSLIDQEISYITSHYPRTEVESWPTQEREAIAYSDKNQSATPLIDGIAKTRNLPKQQVVKRIFRKAKIYKRFCGELIGLRHQLEAQINQASDVKTVKTIDLKIIETLAQELKAAQ